MSWYKRFWSYMTSPTPEEQLDAMQQLVDADPDHRASPVPAKRERPKPRTRSPNKFSIDDAFSSSELNRRINKLREKERLEEIGRAANQILVAYVAANPRHKITQKDVDESLRSAAEIYDLIQLNISQYGNNPIDHVKT